MSVGMVMEQSAATKKPGVMLNTNTLPAII